MVLEFGDPALERRYKQQFARSHRVLDGLCSLTIWVAGMVVIWKLHKHAVWWELVVFWCGYNSALLLAVVTLFQPSFYLEWREELLGVMRVVYVALGIVLHRQMYSTAVSTSDWASFIRNTLILGGQWAQQLVLAFGYHVRLKVHIVLQLGATVLLCCSNSYLESVLGQHAGAQEKLAQLEVGVNSALQWVLPGLQLHPVQLGQHFCVWFWGSMQVVLGFVFTSCMLYSLEMHQRKAFIGNVSNDDIWLYVDQYILCMLPLIVLMPVVTIVSWYHPLLLPFMI